MFLGWIVYGLLTGILAYKINEKLFYSLELAISAAILGSYCGGFLNYLIGIGFEPFTSSGLVMGLFGSFVSLHILSTLFTK